MQFGKGILPAKEYLSNGLFNIQNCYSEAESSFNRQLHFHDFYELSLIYEGSSRFLINGSSFVAAAGSLQLIRPSDYHRQMTDTGEYIRYYNNDRISTKLKGMSPVQYRTHSQSI